MTGPGHEMDPDTVRSGAGKFIPAADDLKDAGAKLKAALEALCNCWGNDESGQAFAKDYEPAAKNCVEACGSLSQACKDVSKSVKEAADATEGIHTDAAQAVKSQGQL
jgi:uncharacterized protein YukE